MISLPLFLGMSSSELKDVRDNVAITERLVRKGETLALSGDACQSLLLIVSGSVRCVTESADGAYSVEELLHAPLLCQPERIFGLHQRYTTTFISSKVCKVLEIRKAMVMKLAMRSVTFRINLLNIVTTQTQKMDALRWKEHEESIDDHIVKFISNHVITQQGYKRLNIHMTVLAREIGCSRLEVSQALHRLEDKELIIMRRGYIEIPMMQML